MKKRGFGKDKWNGIGGKIEKNETEEDALIRECKEEIMVTPVRFSKVAHLYFINKDPNNEPYLIIVHTYLCSRWEGDPTETDEMAPRWFAHKDIPYTEMWDDDIYWLPLVLDGKKVKATFEFDQDNHVIEKDVKEVAEL